MTRVKLFNIFAYTIPGAIFFVVIPHSPRPISQIPYFESVDLKVNRTSPYSNGILILLVISYVLGSAIDKSCSLAIYKKLGIFISF